MASLLNKMPKPNSRWGIRVTTVQSVAVIYDDFKRGRSILKQTGEGISQVSMGKYTIVFSLSSADG